MGKWDSLNARISEGDFEDRFLSLVAEGEPPHELARKVFGVPWLRVRKWIEADPDRFAEYELARRAAADKLMYDALAEVKGADVDTVQLAKLRADRYDRMSGKLDRKSWGDAQHGGGAAGGITVVINRGRLSGAAAVDGAIVDGGVLCIEEEKPSGTQVMVEYENIAAE